MGAGQKPRARGEKEKKGKEKGMVKPPFPSAV
jgi:hypothetical protein